VTWVGHIYIVGVQLSLPSYKYEKVEHPKTEDTQGRRPHINIVSAHGHLVSQPLAKKKTAGS